MLPAVTDITYLVSGIIKNLPTIDKLVKIMVSCCDLSMVIETSDTADEIDKNKEVVIETYNFNGLIKEEMRIFYLRRRKLQENLTKLYGLV